VSTDSQGRPLSDDGQWAWTGAEWVPASVGGAHMPAGFADASGDDPNATRISPSPFARGGAGDVVSQSGYAGAPFGNAGAAFGETPVPVYGKPVGYGTPPGQPRSRRPLILGIVAVVVAIAVAAVLIVTLTGSTKSGPLGAFSCTTPGTSGTGIITFKKGNLFTLGDDSTERKYTKSGDKVTFKAGELSGVVATYKSGSKTLTMTIRSNVLTCKPSLKS
jgi:hypothetical protein